MFIAIIRRTSARGSRLEDVELGPTSTRDDASRLARAWVESHAGATAPDGSRMLVDRVELTEVDYPAVRKIADERQVEVCDYGGGCDQAPVDGTPFCAEHLDERMGRD